MEKRLLRAGGRRRRKKKAELFGTMGEVKFH